ncbi:MAG: glutaredoxin 3 [Legionellaceae bacterium]|nr:glutaredoxin 3 [Legionellaceae bacterium]
MTEVIMYTKTTCGFCKRAAELLFNKNIPFDNIIIDNDQTLRAEMITKSGQHTVPQIFINGTHIGGCDDIYALEEQGKLDKLLQG